MLIEFACHRSGSGQRQAVSAERNFKKSVMPDALLIPSTISLSASVNVLFKME
jgi:hypothetical protein